MSLNFHLMPVLPCLVRKTTKHGKPDIRWKFNNLMEDLDFADDLALISSIRRHIQTKVSNLGRYAEMTGLRMNTAKTMMMGWNNPVGRKVQVDGEELEAVSKSVYLGVTVTAGRGFRRRHQKQTWKSQSSIQQA